MQPRSLARCIVLVSAVVLVLTLAVALPVWAATYRNHVARIPAIPYPNGPARIWMDSDTAFGETAGVEYHLIGTGTYVKVLGNYDDASYPDANWYADIPTFPFGTRVEYQLFTRNE